MISVLFISLEIIEDFFTKQGNQLSQAQAVVSSSMQQVSRNPAVLHILQRALPFQILPNTSPQQILH